MPREQVQLVGGVGLEELVGARPAHDVDVVPIVAPRARKVALRDGETHGLHQMQPRADARARACHVPRVLGDLRLHQHDVEHPCNLSFKQPDFCVPAASHCRALTCSCHSVTAMHQHPQHGACSFPPLRTRLFKPAGAATLNGRALTAASAAGRAIARPAKRPYTPMASACLAISSSLSMNHSSSAAARRCLSLECSATASEDASSLI